jgi:sugar/nucleoside kinase (ribokinase family)
MTRRYDRLLHLGNVMIDLTLNVPVLPEHGGDVLATGTDVSPGGGFNVIVAAVRQGLPVVYAGGHGTGLFGDRARAALRETGVAVLQPPKPGLDTGFVVCAVDGGGERTFLTSRGAEATMTNDDLAPLTAGPRDIVYLSGYSMLYPMNRQALMGWLDRLADTVPVVFDPGPLVGQIPPEVTDRLLPRVDWWTCNAREAAAVTGRGDPGQAALALSARTGRQGVLVRTGPDGCLLALPGRGVTRVAGFPVDAVDMNGAGDAHTGAFVAALARGVDPPAAARAANAAAALAVTAQGPASAPTSDEVACFMAAVAARG